MCTNAGAGAANAGALALSPDGARLAFVATGEDGNDRLWLRTLASLDVRPLAGTEGASFPFFSPDGKELAFFTRRALRRYALAIVRTNAVNATLNLAMADASIASGPRSSRL